MAAPPPEEGPPGGGRNGGDLVCARTGDTRLFVVLANNVDPLVTVDSAKSRYRQVVGAVSDPFVSRSATGNDPNSPPARHADQLDDIQREIMEQIKALLPPECKYANYALTVSNLQDNLGFVKNATIPICLAPKNWKEF
jgi:hypothetical protein